MATLINIYGTGLIVTAMTLYAIRVVHLTAARTGLAMTMAGVVGLLSSVPMGRLADRRGPRDVFQLALLVWGAAGVGYVFLAHSFISFMLMAVVEGLGLSTATMASVALLRRVGGANATTFRSQMTAVLNLGMSLGVATAGVAIQLNTVNAYRALLLGNALSCVTGAVLLGRLPAYEPLPGAREESPFTALRDKAFVGYTV
ncbi:MAG TPA: MFS transporter, partial [Streptosporangiaceae bacterium]|nr:MFS transporter [Streptosporangiaceae bacterium]